MRGERQANLASEGEATAHLFDFLMRATAHKFRFYPAAEGRNFLKFR